MKETGTIRISALHFDDQIQVNRVQGLRKLKQWNWTFSKFRSSSEKKINLILPCSF